MNPQQDPSSQYPPQFQYSQQPQQQYQQRPPQNQQGKYPTTQNQPKGYEPLPFKVNYQKYQNMPLQRPANLPPEQPQPQQPQQQQPYQNLPEKPSLPIPHQKSSPYQSQTQPQPQQPIQKPPQPQPQYQYQKQQKQEQKSLRTQNLPPLGSSSLQNTHFYNTTGLKEYMKQDYKMDQIGLRQDPNGKPEPFGHQKDEQSQTNNNQAPQQGNSYNYSNQKQQYNRQRSSSNRNNNNDSQQQQSVPMSGQRYYNQSAGAAEVDPAKMFDMDEKHQIFKNKYQELDDSAQKEFMMPANQIYNDGRKYTVLMVAEKPSIARSIADALSNGSYNSRKGACKFCQVHEYYGSMFGKNAFFKVTSVIGHVYTTDFPPGYQDWRKIDPVELFEAPTIKKESNPESNIIAHLQQEALGSSYMILWLDNDKEGENICFEVLSLCRPNLMKENFMQIYRAKFSSITTQDIQYAFDNLSSAPNLQESISVDARQVIDLKIGVAFSRFQTRYLVRKYQELSSKKITFGPCQTPTLAFCVARDDEIKSFRSQTFYKPIPRCELADGSQITLEWSKERTYDQQEAEMIKHHIEQLGRFQVVEVENKETSRIRPEALNTVIMLKVASQQIGLGPQQTMQLAEKLYLGGYTTYPRTETTRYSNNFDFRGVLSSINQYRQSRQLSMYAQKLQNQYNKSRAGVDCGDHPPITPTNKPPQNLTPKEQSLYEVIARYFMASISYDAKFYKKKVVFQAGQSQFTIRGTACIDKGFIEIMPWIKIHENTIPNFQEGDQLNLTHCSLHVGQTQPPDHISESDLIGLMEKHGIGTDASMATHINNICEREYVQVVGNSRRLIPTQLGKALFHGFQAIDTELIAPDLRSSIERSVDLIAKGEVEYQDVLKNVIELFKNKYVYFVSNILKLDHFFDTTFSSIDSAIALAQGFTKCGRCKHQAKLLEKVGKLYCEQCKFMYGLPKATHYEAAKDCYCPIDGYQLLLLTINKNGNQKKISVCPLCYQKSPQIEDIQFHKFDRVSCNSCSNTQCNFSMGYNEIANCRHCKSGGRLILDWPMNGKYTMSCNVCNYQYQLCNNGTVYRGRSKCTYCQSYVMRIELNEPEEGYRDMEFEGCVFCDKLYCRIMQHFPPQQEEEPLQKKHNAFLDDEFSKTNERDQERGSGRGGRGGDRGGRGGRGGQRGSDRGGRGSSRGGGVGRGGGNRNDDSFTDKNRDRGQTRGRGGRGASDRGRGGTDRGSRGRGGDRGAARGRGGDRAARGGGLRQNNNNNDSGSKQGGFNYSNNNLQDPMSILRKPIHK